MSRKALLVIDMLNDFLLPGAPLEVPAARDIVPSIAHRIDRARQEGVPVIYLCDNHAPDDPEFEAWPPHAVAGTPGAEVIEELRPQPADTVVPKTRYSGFFHTDLEKVLRDLEAEELIITGILTNICVLYTSCDAFMRGYRIVVPESCVASLTAEENRFALDQMAKLMEAEIGR